MTLPIIIGIAAVCFIFVLIFIIRAISSEDHKAVPISNLNEIKELTSVLNPIKAEKASEGDSQIQKRNKFSEILEKNEPSITRNAQDQKKYDQLLKENDRMKQKIEEFRGAFERLEQGVDVLKIEYDQVKDLGMKEIKKLHDRIEKHKNEKNKFMPAHQTIEDLKAKSILFEKQLNDYHSRQMEMKETIKRLETQRDDLLSKQVVKVDKLEMEELGDRLAGSIATLEAVKGENITLQQSNQELKSTFQKTEEHNELLLEKEKIMHFELAKNRAQALGLEKICEDFKVQIEAMSAMAVKEQQDQA